VRLKFDHIETFMMVVRYGGIRKASERIHLSQPAVTARIQGLEDSLGVSLFDRQSKGMQLTKRGEILLRYAQQHVQLRNMIELEVADPATIDLHLRLGVSETIVQAWLPDFVSAFRDAYPKATVEITVDISINLRQSLLDRSLDLAFLMGPVSDYSVKNVALPDFSLGWFASPNVELPTDPAALFAAHPVVTYARHTRPYREMRTQLFQRYGAQAALFPSSSLSAIFRMVSSGLGVSAVPKTLAEPELQAGRLRPFDPGWQPEALVFTASYLDDADNAIAARAAEIARAVATGSK
jgi:DNA-binding transcriptional LysR family regulator